MNSGTQAKIKKDNTLLFLLLLCVAYMAAVYVLFKLSGITMVRYFLLTVFSVFLPGLALFSVTGITLSKTGLFCSSYITGYACLVAEYYLSELFNRAVSFRTITITVAVASAAYLLARYIIFHRKQLPFLNIKETEGEKIELFFLTVYVILNVFSYSAGYLGPDVVPVFFTSRDMQYWADNTAALKLAWPADNLFMLGNRLNYHYFSSIALAFLSEAYNIDVFTLSFPLYGLTKAIVLTGSVQFLLDAISEDKKVKLLGYVLLLFSTGAETISKIMYVSHILLSPFGFDIGYAYAIVFLGYILRIWDKERFEKGLFACMLLSWLMCVGAKAPVAVVLLLLAAFMCFYWLIQKKWLMAFGNGIPILAGFLAICKYCVGMFSVINDDSAWKMSLFGLDHFTYLGNAENWDALGLFLVMVGRNHASLGILVRIVCLNPVLIFGTALCVIWYIYLIHDKKVKFKDIYLKASLLMTTLFGIALLSFVNAGGDSETYFGMAVFLPMTIIITESADLYFKMHKNEGYNDLTKVKKALFIAFILLIQLGIFRFSWVGWWGDGALTRVTGGLWSLYRANTGYDYSERIEKGIRNTDVDALRWIRDNTPRDAVIMTDKAVLTDNKAYYMYGLFSERQQYLEGTDMLGLAGNIVQAEIARRKKIINDTYYNKDGMIDTVKEEGVDYIVQTAGISDGFKADDNLELVHETETMRIYMIK